MPATREKVQPWDTPTPVIEDQVVHDLRELRNPVPQIPAKVLKKIQGIQPAGNEDSAQDE